MNAVAVADPMTHRLVQERESLVARVQVIKDTAVSQEERDLNADEAAAIEGAKTRIAAIDNQLGLIVGGYDALPEAIAERIARINPGTAQPPSAYRTAGEVMYDMLHRDQPESSRRLERAIRAAEHMGTDAANTVPVAGGFGGVIVKPNVGPVINITPEGRPFLSALGVQESPSALVFMRPRLSDPNFDTGVGEQSAEKAELVSKKFDVLADTVQLVTVGGYLNVSEQLRVFVAGSLDIIVGQLNRRLAVATERAALVELALSGGHIPLAADADGPTILQAIYDASALVYTTTGQMPAWILMGPAGWARLGGLTDLAGRPLFPTLGAANAIGTGRADSLSIGPAGLTPIVTPAMTDDTFWIGNSYALEAYEFRYPLMEALEPSVLGRQVAVASSIGFYRPTTSEAGAGGTPPAEGSGAVHLAP